jgi:hypothetical protein
MLENKLITRQTKVMDVLHVCRLRLKFRMMLYAAQQNIFSQVSNMTVASHGHLVLGVNLAEERVASSGLPDDVLGNELMNGYFIHLCVLDVSVALNAVVTHVCLTFWSPNIFIDIWSSSLILQSPN